ncbi:MAG TPA: hypothetical protein VF423_14580 [Actinomycetes bacterium]
MSEHGFDRLRRRGVEPPPAAPGGRPDPLGRRSLYSVAEQAPALGAVTVECSTCDQTSVVTPRALVSLSLPSLHLPLLRGRHSSWMRCPACRRRTWVRLGLRL